LNRRTGSISESQWDSFLRRGDTAISARIDRLARRKAVEPPDSMIVRECSKVLLLVHDDKAEVRSSIASIIERCKHLFEQQSVLWETARVCAAF
jgi:hypothetical protein